MQFARSTVLQIFLLVLVLSACTPGTTREVTPITASGATPTTARGVTPNTASGVSPTTALGASPRVALTVTSIPVKAVTPNAAKTATPKSNTSSGAATVDTAGATKALERYLGALTSKNESVYTQSICKDWETPAFLEFDAYQGLELVLRDLACSSTGSKPGEAQGTCQGKILMNYGNERQELDLSKRNYRLTNTGDLWLVCGFSE